MLSKKDGTKADIKIPSTSTLVKEGWEMSPHFFTCVSLQCSEVFLFDLEGNLDHEHPDSIPGSELVYSPRRDYSESLCDLWRHKRLRYSEKHVLQAYYRMHNHMKTIV